MLPRWAKPFIERRGLGKECCDLLTAAQAYLEKLAIEELRRAEPWADELARR